MKTKEMISSQAVRLKKIRLYLAMTRKQFSTAVGISQFTVRSWENGEKNFTADGIRRVISALKEKLDFQCSFDWFMYGTGSSPISLCEENSFKKNSEEIQFDFYHENLLKEVVTFKQLNKLATVMVVTDSTFNPIAKIGDYVGLMPVNLSDIDDCIGKMIFISAKDGISEFGILNKNHLGYTNTRLVSSVSSKLIVKDTTELYQFVWLRKIY